MATPTEHALDSVQRSISGWSDQLGDYDEATDTFTGAEYRFAEAVGVSKNGTDIIVRFTPNQALRFCDMIHEELD